MKSELVEFMKNAKPDDSIIMVKSSGFKNQEKLNSNTNRSKDVGGELDGYDFGGYLAKYNNVDRHGDIIEPGMFADHLLTKQTHVLHYDHDTGSLWGGGSLENAVGYFDAEETKDGLYIKAKFFDDPDENTKKAKQLVKVGALNEMSIGFLAERGQMEGIYELDEDGREILTGIRFKRGLITEGSIVRVPANPEAVIDSVKSLNVTSNDSKDSKSNEKDLQALKTEAFELLKHKGE